MGFLPKLSDSEWLFEEKKFVQGHLSHYESIFALANGYMGVRASIETNPALADPGFYVAGIYDQTHGHAHEIVNLPCWLGIGLNVEGFDFDIRKGKILEYYRALDLKQGMLFTRIVWRDAAAHTTRLETVRLLHQQDKHAAVIMGRIVPMDYSAGITMSSSIDAWSVKYASPSRESRFHKVAAKDMGKDGVCLSAATRQTGLEVAVTSCLEVEGAGPKSSSRNDEKVCESVPLRVEKGRAVSFCKTVSVWTSRDSENPSEKASKDLRRIRRISPEAFFRSHAKAWADVWEKSDIRIEGDARAQKGIRFNIFHLASLANPGDDGVSLGAKGLHGNGYSGLVFWDTEIYMLPFYTHTQPETAKALLRYRWRMLDDARKNAKEMGRAGAFYPWTSSIHGRQGASAGWQEHVGSDIAYGIDWYVKASGDRKFWLGEGAEIFLETARYWESRVEWDSAKKAYVVRGLTGPDEIHQHIDNNEFTNYLAGWHLRRACELVEELKNAGLWDKTSRKLRIGGGNICKWKEIGGAMFSNFSKERGFHEQFEGYFKLPDKSIDRKLSRMAYTGPVQASFRPTKVAQQADTVLMYWMFGEDFPDAVKRAGYRYYEPRCSHTSSLSRCIYSALAAQIGLVGEAYRQFIISLENDYAVGKEMESESGIHAACIGGTWLAAFTGFAGIWIRHGRLEVSPNLPSKWKSLSLKAKWRGMTVELQISKSKISARVAERGRSTPVWICGREYALTNRLEIV